MHAVLQRVSPFVRHANKHVSVLEVGCWLNSFLPIFLSHHHERHHDTTTSTTYENLRSPVHRDTASTTQYTASPPSHRHYIGCKSTLLFRFFHLLLGSFFVILSLATSSCDVRVYVLCLGSGPPCRQTDRQTDDQRGAAKVEACVSHCVPAKLSVHLR